MDLSSADLTESLRRVCLDRCYTKAGQALRKDLPHSVYNCVENCTIKGVQTYRQMDEKLKEYMKYGTK